MLRVGTKGIKKARCKGGEACAFMKGLEYTTSNEVELA